MKVLTIQNPGFIASLVAGGGGGDPSLVGHWKFDDDLIDSSANGNNGTAVGSPTYVAGHLGNAISLSGSGQWVDTNENVDYDFGLTDFTVAFWFKTSTLDRGIIGTRAEAAPNRGWGMYLSPLPSGSRINTIVSGSLGVIDDYNTSNTAAFTQGSFQHLVTTFLRSGDDVQVKRYVNATLSGGTLNGTVGDISSPADLLIGTYLGSGYELNGQIDEVRIYNKVLSAGEIADLYAL